MWIGRERKVDYNLTNAVEQFIISTLLVPPHEISYFYVEGKESKTFLDCFHS